MKKIKTKEPIEITYNVGFNTIFVNVDGLSYATVRLSSHYPSLCLLKKIKKWIQETYWTVDFKDDHFMPPFFLESEFLA